METGCNLQNKNAICKNRSVRAVIIAPMISAKKIILPVYPALFERNDEAGIRPATGFKIVCANSADVPC
jgi:hypothetical protein